VDSTAALIAGLKPGNASDQHRFWDLHWREVYTICAHILGFGPEAMDMAVEVLCDFIFKYVHQLGNPHSARSYLRLMATRRSLRHRDGRCELGDENADNLPDNAAVDPEEAAGFSILLPRLADCLARLRPKAQQVIRLRYGREMTNESIGDLVGGSKQYIGRLVRRSLVLLRACLEQTAEDRRNGKKSDGGLIT
jgi:RNA polymerase sigma factor (sigma-70 family)